MCLVPAVSRVPSSPRARGKKIVAVAAIAGVGVEHASRRHAPALVALLFEKIPQFPRRGVGPGQVRLLSPYEAYKLTPEARDALARLELYDVIDVSEREYILERLDQFEGTVGLSELDYLVSWIVCGNRDVESQQTIYNVMEGNTETRH